MIDKKYQTIIGEIRDISSDIARLDGDLTKDRQDLQDFKVQMTTLTEEVEQLRKELYSVLKNVSSKVKKSLQPAVEEVSNLKKEIKQKKMIALKNINFWNFFKIKREEKKA